MGAFSSAIPQALAILATKNGRWDERTPKMRPSEMVALLGLYSGSLPNAIDRIADYVTRSDNATPEGLFKTAIPTPFGLPGRPAGPDHISSAGYVFLSTPPGVVAWKRQPKDQSITYEPVRVGSLVRNDQLEHIVFLREAISDYQRAIQAITQAIRLYPMNQITSRDLVVTFLSGLKPLASGLETMNENPPTTWSQDFKGAMGAALEASEKATVQLANAAGNAAAHVADLAGKVASSAVGGFFDGATLTTLGVAAVVGYVALKGVPF